MNTTINNYTMQMQKAREHLESRTPDISIGIYIHAAELRSISHPEHDEYGNILKKWITEFRHIYDLISAEVNNGRTTFEAKAFIQEATRLVDTYNQVRKEIIALRDRKQDGIVPENHEFYAWTYTIAFCDNIKDTFTPLIEHCRQEQKPDFITLKSYFKADFCGIGSGNEDRFTNELMTKLKQARDGKEAAAIALLIYESNRLNNQKPKTFKKWHEIFCDLTNYPFVNYNPKKIRGTTDKKPTDYAKLLPAFYFLK
jgi:hypothetical protein